VILWGYYEDGEMGYRSAGLHCRSPLVIRTNWIDLVPHTESCVSIAAIALSCCRNAPSCFPVGLVSCLRFGVSAFLRVSEGLSTHA
jgi:hypothetical protein